MADLTKNIVSVVAILLFVIGTGLTMVGVFKTSESSEKNLEEAYIIPSQVLNGLTVMFLLYLTSTSDFTPLYKLLIIVMLVGGMMVEIYLTSFSNRQPESIAAYIFLTMNFLIRTFFLFELVQGQWVKPFTSPVKPIQQAVKEAVAAAPAAIENVVAPKVEAPSPDAVSNYKDKFKSLVREIKSKNPDFDNMTIVRDAWPIIDNAAKSGEFTKEHLKEALDKIKNKDGTSVSGVSVGGRKRS